MCQVDQIDWDLLHKQKMALLDVIITGIIKKEETSELLDGLVQMLDEMQDNAVEFGVWSFPETKE